MTTIYYLTAPLTTQPPIKLAQGVISLGVKRPGRESGYGTGPVGPPYITSLTTLSRLLGIMSQYFPAVLRKMCKVVGTFLPWLRRVLGFRVEQTVSQIRSVAENVFNKAFEGSRDVVQA
jgi:hypothetical protein